MALYERVVLQPDDGASPVIVRVDGTDIDCVRAVWRGRGWWFNRITGLPIDKDAGARMIGEASWGYE